LEFKEKIVWIQGENESVSKRKLIDFKEKLNQFQRENSLDSRRK